MSYTIDEITALERAYEDLSRVVSNLGVDELAKPTNCPSGTCAPC